MLFLVLGLALPRQIPDRAAFDSARRLLRGGMTAAQVRAILGPPDDIWTPSDSSLFAYGDQEIWCYGSDHHLGLPTLGRIPFKRGRLDIGDRYQWPSISNLPPEAQLQSVLKTLYLMPSRDPGFDPLWAIRAANALRSLGKEKALATLRQYSVLVGDNKGGNSLFWLTRLVFDGPMPIPAIGRIDPPPPKDAKDWPTFPLIVKNDVPYNVYRNTEILGFPEPFSLYLDRVEKDWTIRPGLLKPPDNPFPTFKFKGSESVDQKQLLRLVREVVGDPGAALEDAHKRFLDQGGRWDPEQQRYVKRDGSFIPVAEPYFPAQSQTLTGIPRIKVELSVERESPEKVNVTIELNLEGKPVSGKMRLFDPTTNSPLDENLYKTGKTLESGTYPCNIDSLQWLEVQFEITISGKTYRSRVFRA